MKEPSLPVKSTALVRESEHATADLAQQSFMPRYGYGGYDEIDRGGGGGYARLREYWGSIRKHLWLIVGITVIVTMLAAIYMARQPDIYEARTRVQVDLELSNPALGSIKSNSFVLNTPYQD
ncbi:MAG TPA: Wzz/FepE/Etk N-terminal domain-containing protein, partial [Pyrinomonadaceae bacterium]|nr:Wzz/FepE/Etk N-terminal domain-containing protein [Pyrinomonadaceae bacterium]